jgi:hypothetical protein
MSLVFMSFIDQALVQVFLRLTSTIDNLLHYLSCTTAVVLVPVQNPVPQLAPQPQLAPRPVQQAGPSTPTIVGSGGIKVSVFTHASVVCGLLQGSKASSLFETLSPN